MLRGRSNALKLYADQKGVKIIPSVWGTSPGAMTYATPSLHETIALKGMPFEVRGDRIVHRKSATPIRNASGRSAYPGLRGFMYTTWINEYSKIDTFVRELRGNSAR